MDKDNKSESNVIVEYRGKKWHKNIYLTYNWPRKDKTTERKK